MTDTTATAGSKSWLLIALLIPALALVLWLPGQLEQTPVHSSLPSPACLISSTPCVSQKDEQSITMFVQDDTIKSMQPLTFTVQLDNILADSVLLDLKGRDMYMGINQVQLSPVVDQPGTWQGTTELAVCVTGEMRWFAQVVAQTASGSISTQFEFDAQ